MQFEEDDSSSIMGRQEKKLFFPLQETSSVGCFIPPLLLGFPATDEEDWQDPLAVTWLAQIVHVLSILLNRNPIVVEQASLCINWEVPLDQP